MKLKLSEAELKILNQGSGVTIQRPVEIPDNVMAQFQILQNYPVKSQAQLDGVCEGVEDLPLITGVVRLNVKDSCVEFEVYSQYEVVF